MPVSSPINTFFLTARGFACGSCIIKEQNRRLTWPAGQNSRSCWRGISPVRSSPQKPTTVMQASFGYPHCRKFPEKAMTTEASIGVARLGCSNLFHRAISFQAR